MFSRFALARFCYASALALLVLDPGTAAAADADVDGWDDALDNCVFFANPTQADTDGDGIGDLCDVCPNGAGNTDSDSDGICDTMDRCPGADDASDSDGDGVPAGCDNCPLVANNSQLDVDGDGSGNACDGCTDVDGDGVGDAGFTNTLCVVSNGPDNCRYAANPTQSDTDEDGSGDACDAGAAASVSVIGGSTRKLNAKATTYFGAFGAPAKASTTESSAQWTMPADGSLAKLHIRLSANAGVPTASYTFTVRVNGTSPMGTLSCTVTGATSTCTDTTGSVAYSAGDLLAIQATPSSPDKPAKVDVQWTATATGS